MATDAEVSESNEKLSTDMKTFLTVFNLFSFLTKLFGLN